MLGECLDCALDRPYQILLLRCHKGIGAVFGG